MANLKHIADSGQNPNTPTAQEMRASQEMGSKGKGTQSEDYAAQEACFNMGTGKDGEPDKTAYPRPSNDAVVAEYLDGEGLPWE